ncbi:helix-turn-helix domain-containing protein [Nocardia sp. NPDC050175]|uniref:helix-turn-helix domain-containing protein n=1 Tax=Nocardia sp. NPDC050175 TaxID=3364317 RepID=UPI003793D6DC
MSVAPVRIAEQVMDVAVPARSGRLAGVSMAGFRGRADRPIELRMVPYPAFTMFIDFGDVWFVDEADGARRHGSGVVGPAPARVRGCGQEVDVLQVRLSPVVAHAVLGASAELGGTVVALEDLWGSDAARIQEQLHAAESWDERFSIAKAALIRRQEAGRAVDPEVAFAWARIVLSRGRIRVERLAAEVGWSYKRLWSRFRSQVGLTPKRAAQLVRFDYAAHRLAEGHSAALVAAESGYVDQSHLCRDAMAFAGVTPAGVAVAPWLAVDPVAWAAPEYASRA